MNLLQISCACLMLPFLGAIFSYIRAYNNYKNGLKVCIGVVLISFLGSCYIFYNFIQTQIIENLTFFTWIKSETIQVDWGARFDSLSTLMILVITLISSIVHIYSIEYMREDSNKLIFFGHLNLFTFMMIFLVLAPNMLQLFCGWEGVSLASYLLIGYWNNKPRATHASFKAFSINRISDVGLVLALGSIFTYFHTLDFDNFFSLLKESEFLPNTFWLNIICLFLFFSAMGKSGQFGLHIWLPDAMEAPTPVSALLHAATMVTAGVFLIIRFSPLFELAFFAKQIMMFIGTLTGLVTGLIALTEIDIKKIVAYSTCSQLGFMFMACAADAYTAAFFHLFTHAFFKALIFLSAGNIIHAMSHEQSIMKMGGLKNYLRSSHYVMLIGILALVGFPITSGAYSKEFIVSSIYLAKLPFSFEYFIASLLLIFITSLYAWRVFFVVFYGKVNANEQIIAHIQKVKKVMLYPIYLLAIGAISMGYIGFELLINQSLGFHWDQNIISQVNKQIPLWMKLSMFISSGAGFLFSYFFHIQKKPVYLNISEKFPKIHQSFKEKLYIDELYFQKILSPLLKLGHFLYWSGDKSIIDKFGPEGLSNLVCICGDYLKKRQTTYLFYHVFIAVLGIVLVLTVYILTQIFPVKAKKFLFMAGQL